MDKKLKAVRKRLLNDFPFYSKAVSKCAPKKVQSNRWNSTSTAILQDAIDKQMADEGNQVIILKARQ